MPLMNGPETTKWLASNYPIIKLVALSMEDSDKSILSMIKAGCCAYLLKDTHPMELEKAIFEINEKGCYNGDAINVNYRRLIKSEDEEHLIKINNKEMEFLQLACSDLTYKQIAERMFMSERTIDGYRESLFNKFKVSTRVGLALEGVRLGYFKFK
jgi:DNA-binding NarL/FixJ family response regulator